ncbi:hypothetical protein B296_00032926 [Ensete ventricosum]|uniref:Uncharacterized protein n=1 Tax=Ensete ventricosum TaxID=4639 RepID=A0A426Y4C0_ENSVE|nr:hypothetical protein B296_00032926 [Ensete ventricosum]
MLSLAMSRTRQKRKTIEAEVLGLSWHCVVLLRSGSLGYLWHCRGRGRDAGLLRLRSLGYLRAVEDEAEAQGCYDLGPWAVSNTIENETKA